MDQQDSLHTISGLEGSAKKKWLSDLGFADDKSVKDCDVTAQTITFVDESGEEYTRQVSQIWTRVMGYCRPTSSFNIGKRGEFAARKYFKEPEGLSDGDD